MKSCTIWRQTDRVLTQAILFSFWRRRISSGSQDLNYSSETIGEFCFPGKSWRTFNLSNEDYELILVLYLQFCINSR